MRKWKSLLQAGPVFALLLALAGCGAANNVTSGTSPTPAATSNGSTTTAGTTPNSSGTTTAGSASSTGTSSSPDSGGDPSTTPSAAVASPVSLAAAARLLDQATFGPTSGDLATVQAEGVNLYLQQQFAMAATLLAPIPNPLPAKYVAEDATLSQDECWGSEWWQNALTAPDQLRQRVAFALSHIYVVSNDSLGGRATTFYYNILLNDAFGNWRQLMEDVTTSPGMGTFLNIANSAKAPAGQIANENFARENMQLFSLGPNLLNADGTLQTDANGNPIPTYTQAQVQAFARAFTGWTYVQAPGQAPTGFPSYSGRMDLPLGAVEEQHDQTQKTLLNGVVLPAGQSAQQDLDAALDDLFQHPNLPPFISRQLIQHLVSSHPSPAYVGRVAAVFVNNGAGVRGDMKAVLTAILTDPEARAGDTDSSFDAGHLREPLLYGASVLRGVGVTPNPPDPTQPWPYILLLWQANTMGQFPMNAPSVFGFFQPGYVIPETTVNAPEFGIENTASVASRMSFADLVATNNLWQMTVNIGSGSPLYQAAANGPGTLVDALGTMYLHGQMPADMRTALINAITPIADTEQQVQVALYLVITSSQYKISH